MGEEAISTEVDNIQSHCCFCSMQCGIDVIKGKESIQIKPSKDFPVATGRLCQKGLNSLEHVIHPDRITSPMIRLSSNTNKTNWKRVEWGEALQGISIKIKELQTAYGKDVISVFGGGSLTNEVAYLLGKFTRVALQSKYIDYNGRYCMSSAAAAANKAFGIDRGIPFPLEEIMNTDYIILAGTNIAECQPTLMPYLLAAKKNGAIIVTIDPRQTMTSKIADIEVRLRPGFDSVFVNGLLHVMIKENLIDEVFVKKHTEGFEQVKSAVQEFTPARVEEITDILEEVTRTIARGFAKAKKGMVFTARGLEQQVNGVENTLNYINLCLVTGKIGKSGSGYGAITGQANGQGGREHGQKADQLPGYRMINDLRAREHVAKVWGIAAEEIPDQGVSAYEMIEKIEQNEIKGMIVLGSNPIVSSPNRNRVKKALEKLELLVVIDLFVTETAELADWFLPGSSFLEAEGTLTNLEGRVFHRPQVLELPGEAKHDYEIISRLAAELGRGEFFSYYSIEDVFNELRLASQGGKADYSGITYRRLQEKKGIYWPCPDESHAGTPRLFENGFYHPNKRATLHGITPKKPAEPTDAEYPYVLTTGRLANHYLSGAQTRRTDKLNKKAPIPLAEIHPWLAKKYNIGINDQICISSRRGSIQVHVKITAGIHPRTIFVPFHWGKQLSINQITNDALDPTSRMPEFKNCAVKINKVMDQ